MFGFAVLTTVSLPAEQLAETAARLAAESRALAASPPAGFLGQDVLRSEDGTEVVLVTRWAAREHFLAFRGQEEVRQRVLEAMEHRPKISFLLPVESVRVGPPGA